MYSFLPSTAQITIPFTSLYINLPKDTFSFQKDIFPVKQISLAIFPSAKFISLPCC